MGSFFTYSSCNQTALSEDNRAKARDVTPNVSYLRLRTRGGRGGEGERESERKKKQSVVGRHRGLSYKGRARNVTNQKTQSFTATEGKNTTPQPHHDIAFWS